MGGRGYASSSLAAGPDRYLTGCNGTFVSQANTASGDTLSRAFPCSPEDLRILILLRSSKVA